MAKKKVKNKKQDYSGLAIPTGLLLGLGFDWLSVAPLVIPKLKDVLRNTNLEELKINVAEMLKLETPGEVRKYADRAFSREVV